MGGFLSVEFLSSLCILDTSPLSDVFCKYFLPICGLSSHFGKPSLFSDSQGAGGDRQQGLRAVLCAVGRVSWPRLTGQQADRGAHPGCGRVSAGGTLMLC